MAARGISKCGSLPGYFEGLQHKDSKRRYLEKMKNINGEDPYEIPRSEWIDDVDSVRFQRGYLHPTVQKGL